MASRRPLRILTYNVWFSTKYMKERMRGIGDIIEAHEPDLVALQEVTSEVLLHLSNQRWYKEYHKTVPNNRERYFVMIFSKTPLLEYEKVSFPNSHMGRELVVTRIAVSYCVHLLLCACCADCCVFHSLLKIRQIPKPHSASPQLI